MRGLEGEEEEKGTRERGMNLLSGPRYIAHAKECVPGAMAADAGAALSTRDDVSRHWV